MSALDNKPSKQKLEPAFYNIVRFAASPSGKPYLIGKRCCGCGQYTIGNKIVCPNCYSEEFEERPISPRGTLYSYSISYVTPWGFEAPLAVGMIDLPEGLRIWSQLEVDPEMSLEIGMAVEMVVGRIRMDEENNEILGFKFKPVRS
jgi:uncharacterized OB-fold protein